MSSGQNSPKSRFMRSPSTSSCDVINPRPLMSKIRKASTKLKSDFKARSILADSMSRSTKITSFKVFANSFYSTLSRQEWAFTWCELHAGRDSIFWLGLRYIYLCISLPLGIDCLSGDDLLDSIEFPRRGLILIGLPPWASYSPFLALEGDPKSSFNLAGDLYRIWGDRCPYLLLLGYSRTLTAFEKLTDLFILEGEFSN